MKLPEFFIMNPHAHFMAPGSVGFIPPWIFMFITIFTFVSYFPRFFRDRKDDPIISPYLLAFFIGSLMPIFDDLSAFIFGPPYAHHSVFHSLFGSLLTYVLFRIISTPDIAKYAFFGNLTHTFFNFYFDYVTLFFPFTYREFGLTDILRIDTFWIKAIHYPIILILFFFSMLRFFHRLRIHKVNS